MRILITGCAGFIGFHCSKFFSEKKGFKILGIDNLDDYYDIKIKKKRLNLLKKNKNFSYLKIDLNNEKKLGFFFKKNKIDLVIHLAAQAGVRYSFTNPKKYLNVNINGFFNILENMKNYKIKKILFASSSSIYGNSKKFPLNEEMHTSHQISLYGTTKKYNEMLAYYYYKQFKISSYGLRFFTAYGPWGRPDMSIFKFSKNMLLGKSIDIFNYGNHQRDFTYIDDVINCIFKLTKKIKSNEYKILNIAGGQNVRLMHMIKLIEKNLNLRAKMNYKTLQKGDVVKTRASTKALKKLINYTPKVKIEEGINHFCKWFIREKKFLLNLK